MISKKNMWPNYLPLIFISLLFLKSIFMPAATWAGSSRDCQRPNCDTSSLDHGSLGVSSLGGTTQASDLAQSQAPYILGPGDLIDINVFDAPEYSGQQQVLIDGSINLPLVGRASVQGLTLKQASDLISSLYATTLKRPLITLKLLASAPVVVGVTGEVARSGFYTLEASTQAVGNPDELGIQYPTLTQAIEQAGGVTVAANIGEILIRRQQAPGQEESFQVDLWKFLRLGDPNQNITLRNGDSIFVPTATKLNFPEVRQLTATGFVEDLNIPRRVTVTGAVNNPGTYLLVGGVEGLEVRTAGLPTVTSALKQAGGIDLFADISRIQIRRFSLTGEEQIINVDLWKLLQEGDVGQDVFLREGDSIVVPKQTDVNPAETSELARASFAPEAIKIWVGGEVPIRGLIEVPLNTTLNQALMAAGGFNNRSRRNSVDLVRINPNGTATRRKVEVDFSAGINEETNPILNNYDIIIIDRSRVAKVIMDNWGPTLEPLTRLLSFFQIIDLLN
jgi:polysaccharide export outer membrane protein